MPSIISGSLMRATPPSRRMSAGTRSSAITAQAPASSAILACSGVTTSMMTPPFSISARPRLTGNVPVTREEVEPCSSHDSPGYRPDRRPPEGGSGQVTTSGARRASIGAGQLDPGAAGGQLDRGAVGGGERGTASVRSARVHVPCTALPPVYTVTSPVPMVCASGLFASTGLGW